MNITATALPRIMECDGPVFLAEHAVKNDSSQSESAIEGNAAHTVVRNVIDGVWYSAFDQIGQEVNGNYIVTDDMANNLQPHIDWLMGLNSDVMTEENTDWKAFPDTNQITGRADYITTVGNTLHIDDLKYGWRVVEPEKNWTLISHAIGFCVKTGFVPDAVTFTIHQPRPWHNNGTIRSWSIGFDELDKLQKEIWTRLSNIGSTVKTGPHCYKCPVAHVCPSARLAALNAVDMSISGYAEILDGSSIGQELQLLNRAAKAIETRKKAIETQAIGMLEKGKPVNGYALDFAYGRKAWKKGTDAETIKLLSGVDVSKSDMITPTQAAKKGVPDFIIDQMSETPTKGYKLVEMDVNKKAMEIFQNG